MAPSEPPSHPPPAPLRPLLPGLGMRPHPPAPCPALRAPSCPASCPSSRWDRQPVRQTAFYWAVGWAAAAGRAGAVPPRVAPGPRGWADGGTADQATAPSLGSGGQSQREDPRGRLLPLLCLSLLCPGRHPAPGPAAGGDMVAPGHSPPRCPPPAPLTVPCPSSSPALGGLGRLGAWSGADLAVCPEPRSSERRARWSAACSRFSHVLASRLTWQQTKR